MKKIAIAGYGNLGRGAEAALMSRDDMELCAMTLVRICELYAAKQ